MNLDDAINLYRSGEKQTVDVLVDLGWQIEQLKETVARKSTNSSNSSKPPSSDGFVKPLKKRRAQDGEAKRKPGGQKGHKGITRELFPLDQVREILPFYPEKCKKCGTPVPDNPTPEMFNSEPIRHQQFEIPRVPQRASCSLVTTHRRESTQESCLTPLNGYQKSLKKCDIDNKEYQNKLNALRKELKQFDLELV